MKKYKYAGQNNERCPVCGKRIKGTVGPPAIYFIKGVRFKEHRWCVGCFESVHKLMAVASSSSKIEEVILPALNSCAWKALSDFPEDHEIRGFSFLTVPNQGLTLVMELTDEY